MSGPEPTFFVTPEDFRAWLEANHETARELLVGFYKKGSGRPSITWPQSVGEALCFGWIDGVRRRIDDEAYCIRFTPRKRDSHWSAVNVARVAELEREGRMRPAGLAAFAARRPERTAQASFEQTAPPELAPEAVEAFREQSPDGWAWFSSSAPSYQRAAAHWIASAKRPETRERRLRQLILDSAERRRVGPLRPPGG